MTFTPPERDPGDGSYGAAGGPRYEPVARGRQRMGGAFIAAASAGVVWLTWSQAVTAGRFLVLGAFAGPAFLVMGLALVAWPGYREERIARGENIAGLEGTALITPRWWGVLAAGLLAGGAFALALGRGWLGAPR